MSGNNAGFQMPTSAHALRPMKCVGQDEGIYFSAITFAPDPATGCQSVYSYCQANNWLADNTSPYLIDVIDAEWDILDSFALTEEGFEILVDMLEAEFVEGVAETFLSC